MQTFLAVLALHTVFMHATAVAQPKAVAAADTTAAVQAAMQAYITAAKMNDAATLAAVWATDGVYMGEGTPTLRGRSELEAFLRGAFKSARVDFNVTVDDVEAGQDMASVTGTFAETLHAHQKPPQSVAGRYLLVFRRQPDGSWKISRGMGTDMPGPPK
jgi:uncharacterized protein (TIGR02246 family)